MDDAQKLATERRGLTPLLTVKPASEAIAFYKDAFGAEELYRLVDPSDGRIGHAELLVHGHLIMLADEYPEAGALAPPTLGGSPVRVHLSVPDVDLAADQAVQAGASLVMSVATQFHGDRTGVVSDPFGYIWLLTKTVEEIPPAEMQRRWNDMTKP